MAFDKKSALSHIPEFYLEEKAPEDIIVNSDGIYENAELLNPNSVNLTANLIDMINSKRVAFNNWNNIDDYIQEFKLDTLFPDEKFYSVKQPELLKGFFKFKGTDTDIKYIMKVAGYDLVIHQHNPIIAYGLNGAKDEASGAIYEEEMDHSFDCKLTSELYIDLDRPNFEGFRSREVVRKIRGLLDARIALCVYLSAIELNLVTRTFFPIREKLDDAQLIDLKIEHSSDFKQLVLSSDPTSRVANNVNPYKADGTPIIGLRVYIPVYDFIELDVNRIICDRESFVNDKIYSRKVDNRNPQSVQSGTVDNCNYPALQGQATNNPFERGYDYRVDNTTPIVIDNVDKVVVEGRLYQLGDTFIKEEDTPVAVAIGGNRHYRVHNTNPIKIRNSKPERQIIEDNTFDVQSSKTTVDTHFRYKQMSDSTLVHLDKDVNDFLDDTKMSISNVSPFKVGNLPFKIKGNSESTVYRESNLVDLDKEVNDTYYMSEQDFGYIVDNQSGAKVVNIHWKKQIIVQGGKPKFYSPVEDTQLTNDIGWELTNKSFYLSGNSLEELQELYPSSSYTIEYTPKTIIISVLDNELSYNVDNKGKLKVRGKSLTQIDDYSIGLSFDLGLTKDEIDIHLINTVSDNLITSFSEDFLGGDLHLLNNVGGLLVTNNQPLSVKGQANKMEYLSDDYSLDILSQVSDTFCTGHRNYSKKVDGSKVINDLDFNSVVQGISASIYPLDLIYRVGEKTIIADNINPIKIKGRLIQEGETFAYSDRTVILLAVDNSKAHKVENIGTFKVRGINSLMIEDFELEVNAEKTSVDEIDKILDYGIIETIDLQSNNIDVLGATVSIDNTRAIKLDNIDVSKVKGSSAVIEYLSDDLELRCEIEVQDNCKLTFKDYHIAVDGRVINNNDIETVRGQEPTVYPLAKVYRVGEETVLVDNINPIEIKGRLIEVGEVFEYTDNTLIPVAVDNKVALKVDNCYPMKTAGVIFGYRNYEEILLIQAEIEFSPYRLRIGGYDVLDTKRGYVGHTKVNNDSKSILLEAVV